MRSIDAWAFSRVVLRRTPWVPMIAVTACATALGAWWSTATSPGEELTLVVRLATIALAAVGAGALVDGAEDLTATTPLGRTPRRTAGSMAVVVPLGIGWWIVAVVSATAGSGGPIPNRGLFVELIAMTLASLALASAVANRGSPSAVSLVAPAVFGCGFISLQIDRVARLFWVSPLSATWRDEQIRWLFVALASVALFGGANRDPASRRLRRSR